MWVPMAVTTRAPLRGVSRDRVWWGRQEGVEEGQADSLIHLRPLRLLGGIGSQRQCLLCASLQRSEEEKPASWRWATPRRGLPLLLRKGAWLWDPALLCDMEPTLTPLFIPALSVLGASGKV